MNASFRQIIANDFANLNGLMEGATEFLESQGVDDQAVYRINLALEEMVSNIIKYGYDSPGRHKIEVALEVNDGGVALAIVDDGHEFNPLLQERKPPPNKLEDREPGGLGIHLIKRLLERIDYRRAEGRNYLEITIRRQPARPSA